MFSATPNKALVYTASLLSHSGETSHVIMHLFSSGLLYPIYYRWDRREKKNSIDCRKHLMRNGILISQERHDGSVSYSHVTNP
jgi:hypothetical protein